MTTLAFVAGMIPLIVPRGIGSHEPRHRLVVYRGQSLALLLTCSPPWRTRCSTMPRG
jgi:hypothetical protein